MALMKSVKVTPNRANIVPVVLILLAGCGSLKLSSHWRDVNTVIDGKSTGWFSVRTPIDGDRTSVAIVNDDENLYIGLVTISPALQRTVTREGLVVWFDNEGGDTKKFGIRYPLPSGKPTRGPGEEGGDELPLGMLPRRDDSGLASNELEILQGGEDRGRRMTKMEAGGIELRYHFLLDTLFYELKIPLSESGVHPFAVGAKPGTVLGVGIETAAWRASDSPRQEGGARPDRGSGGRRGGVGGGGRGREGGAMNRGDGGSRPEPLKVWSTVRLAEK
jgi:hypothetical protein